LATINLPTCCLKSRGYRVPRIDARFWFVLGIEKKVSY
jgi:hypothetical protein